MLKTISEPMAPIFLSIKASQLFFDFWKSETECPRNGSAVPAQSINSNEVLISVNMSAPAFVDDVLMNKICALMSLMWLRDTYFNQLAKSKMIGREREKKNVEFIKWFIAKNFHQNSMRSCVFVHSRQIVLLTRLSFGTNSCYQKWISMNGLAQR